MADKFYCFYCQKEVEPKGFWFLKFCPYCKHRIIDSGEGFYRICDFCGADNSVSAKTCVKCKHQLSGEEKNEVEIFRPLNPWVQMIINALLIMVAAAFFILILYVSFYLVLAFLLFAVVYYLMLKAGFKI